MFHSNKTDEIVKKKEVLEVFFLGPESSGKTSLMSTYIGKKYIPNVSKTIGTDFLNKDVSLGGETVTIRTWDTSYPEKYGSFPDRHIKRNADFYILCVDLSDPDGLDKLDSIIKEYDLYGSRKSTHGMLVVGTKSDIWRPGRDIAEFLSRHARQGEIRFVETSALYFKNGNVDECFQQALAMIETSRKLTLERASKLDVTASDEKAMEPKEIKQGNASVTAHSLLRSPVASPAVVEPAAQNIDQLHIVLRLRPVK